MLWEVLALDYALGSVTALAGSFLSSKSKVFSSFHSPSVLYLMCFNQG